MVASSVENLTAYSFSLRIFLFFDLDYQNLATLGFDNCLISEKENLSQKKKFRPRVFLPLSNLFLATKNIYIVCCIFLFDQAVVIGIEKKEDKWHEKWGLASL